jgi:hypothetical protein
MESLLLLIFHSAGAIPKTGRVSQAGSADPRRFV